MTSKLILGTVQLGLNYGVNNSFGKPTLSQSFEILINAYDNGIRILDTAEAYGDSQEVIGKFHKKNPNKKFEIITKLAANTVFQDTTIIDVIREDCKVLQVEKLHGYMFHDYDSFKGSDKQFKLLLKAKELGLVEKIGTSLYTNEALEDVINNYEGVNIIQIPFNLLDNESKRKDILEKAKAKDIEVHTRSAFLQGLFFKEVTELSKIVAPLKPYLGKIKKIEVSQGLKTEELALKYALSKPYIDYVLIGVDNVQQLLKNIAVSQQQKNIDFSEIDSIQVIEKELLNPANW